MKKGKGGRRVRGGGTGTGVTGGRKAYQLPQVLSGFSNFPSLSPPLQQRASGDGGRVRDIVTEGESVL